MGHASMHWVDRISSMFFDYTTCNDSELWIANLMCVEVCIQNTWLKPSSDEFAEIVLRIVFNASVFTDKEVKSEMVRDEIHKKISYGFELLSQCENFDKTKVQLQEILKSSESKQLQNLKVITISN